MARTSYAVKRGHSKATLWALWSSVLFYSRFFKAEILDLGIGYLDDLTLGGNTETVAAKVQLTETESKNLGLHLNHSKGEMCHKNRMSIKAQTFQNCIKVTTDEMTLLGATLVPGPAVDLVLESKANDLDRAIRRQCLLHTHDDVGNVLLIRVKVNAVSTGAVRRIDEIKTKWKQVKANVLKEQTRQRKTGSGRPMKERPFKEIILYILGDRSDAVHGIRDT